jgi:hypothetical protein
MSHKVGSSRLVTGSPSYLEGDLQESGDPLTLVQLIANLGEPRITTGGVNLVVGFKPKSLSSSRCFPCQAIRLEQAFMVE